MKKRGYILPETIIAFAIFAALACPMLFLLQENILAQRYTYLHEQSACLLRDSLEELYAGAYPEIETELSLRGDALEEISYVGKKYYRHWHVSGSLEEGLKKISLKLVWDDERGKSNENRIEFLFPLP